MKNRDDFAALAREILAGEWDDHLEGLANALTARHRDRRTERSRFNAVSVRIGDEGTLTGISPKYLDGCPVRVTGKGRTTLDVIALEEAEPRQWAKLCHGGRVPASAFVIAAENDARKAKAE